MGKKLPLDGIFGRVGERGKEISGKEISGEPLPKPRFIVPRSRPDVDMCVAFGLSAAKMERNFRCACPQCLAVLGLTLVYDPKEVSPIVHFWEHRVVTARTARLTPEELWVPGYHPHHGCPIPQEPSVTSFID